MNERRQSIKEYLQQSDVQDRLWKEIQEARSKATVTISRAASLFNFSESQLREWEKRGLLRTERPVLSPEGKNASGTGHRQYTPAELDKLAIIRELMDRGYTTSDIPSDVDKIWEEVSSHAMPGAPGRGNHVSQSIVSSLPKEHRPIDKRLGDMDQQEFWRYFVSQALRISLLLMYQAVPDTVAGFVLPLEDGKFAREIDSPYDLHKAGLSLVGWLGRVRSFYAFLDEAPSFEFPSDFRLEKLPVPVGQEQEEDRVLDNVFIVVQRRSRSLPLSPELVETVRRVLGLVYTYVDEWRHCFDYGRQDWLYQSHSLESVSSTDGDVIFNSLLEKMIELGGKTTDGQDRWDFAALLLPNDTNLPIQQQNLILRAQTSRSPYEIGHAVVNPALTDSISLKAFQSGQIVYISETLLGQTMITYQLPPVTSRETRLNPSMPAALEVSTRSALAIPIIGESGIAVAALYLAARDLRAFSQADQRALRILSRMMEELLLTSRSRRQVTDEMSRLITYPAVVDATFQAFGSETNLIAEIEELLTAIKENSSAEMEMGESLAMISIDIDNQSSLALRYGNRAARNVSQQMGYRIRGQMQFSDRYAAGKLFHLSADKYLLVLRGLSLDDTRNLAKQLKEALQGLYRINPSYTVPNRPALPENMLDIPDITVHLGVSHFPFTKIEESLIGNYNTGTAVSNMRGRIMAAVEQILARGKSEGGDCIITWDNDTWGLRRLD